MATPQPSSGTLEPSKPPDPPQWQRDKFNQSMRQWEFNICDTETYDENGNPNEPVPEILQCFSHSAEAAFHFQSFSTIILKWQGLSVDNMFDGLEWVRQEEPKIAHNLKGLLSSMEKDFEDGKFLTQTCTMEVKNLNRAVYGLNQVEMGSGVIVSHCLVKHLNALDTCLGSDKNSRWWELYQDVCLNLCSTFEDTLRGLQSLVLRADKTSEPSISENEEPVDSNESGTPGSEPNGRTTNAQGGLRRRRPDIPAKTSASEDGSLNTIQDPRDHTPLEAMALLARALDTAFRKIPFADLRDALWKDDRAPVSMSLLFTSISSVLIGVALATHNRHGGYSRPGIDDGFFTLLSNTIVQLFSLYVLLLPFLRGQESHLRGLWFCLSIGLSFILSVVACIVYAFSWHASAILSFGGTLASMIVSLLLVQSIDQGSSAKESVTANGDV